MSKNWDHQAVCEAVEEGAAVRRVVRMQPAAGKGAKIFPPTYPDTGHLVFRQRIDGEEVQCVVIDSVQSQANRLELALADLMDEGKLTLPIVLTTFADGTAITSLTAPHRVYDAILRDSELDGVRWLDTEIGKRLIAARPESAAAVFEVSPTSLLFGAWYSTGINTRGSDAKFERLLTSEITGVGVSMAGRAAVRRDPLNIPADFPIFVPKGEHDWYPEKVRGDDDKLYEGGEKRKPSGVVHSNIISRVEERGVTVDYVLMSQLITCAGARRVRVRNDSREANAAARAVLAALGVLACVAQDRMGYSLRSGCTLVAEGPAQWEVIGSFGDVEPIDVNLDGALRTYEEAVANARTQGVAWRTDPVRLTPTDKLQRLAAAGLTGMPS